jgi:hypothetical protein
VDIQRTQEVQPQGGHSSPSHQQGHAMLLTNSF